MRFMMLVIPKGYETAKPGTMPDAKAIDAMSKFNESLQKAGVLLDANGLQPSAEGWRIHYRGGERRVVDGPFAETKELIAGYTLIQVRNRDEAMEWARRFPAPMGEGVDAVLEVRPLYELGDFEPSEAIERERRIGEKLAKRV